MTMALSSFIIITVKISIKDLYSCLNSSINPSYKMILLGSFMAHKNAQQIASYKNKFLKNLHHPSQIKKILEAKQHMIISKVP